MCVWCKKFNRYWLFLFFTDLPTENRTHPLAIGAAGCPASEYETPAISPPCGCAAGESRSRGASFDGIVEIQTLWTENHGCRKAAEEASLHKHSIPYRSRYRILAGSNHQLKSSCQARVLHQTAADRLSFLQFWFQAGVEDQPLNRLLYHRRNLQSSAPFDFGENVLDGFLSSAKKLFVMYVRLHRLFYLLMNHCYLFVNRLMIPQDNLQLPEFTPT